MEENINPGQQQEKISYPSAKEKTPEVVVIRNWKDYLGESFLIIFSVLLALFLTEIINNFHEKEQTRGLVNNIRDELVKNKTREQELYQYDLLILKNIDSALKDKSLQQQLVSGGEFHYDRIIPNGVLYRYLDNVAWEVARNHNISSKIDFKIISALTRIYEDQAKTTKIEDEIAKIIFSRESTKIENIGETLILIRNNYKGWAVDRAPGLLDQYDKAINALEHY